MSDVLIVETDPVLLDALAETMNLAGHSYLAAKDGKEALRMLESEKPAIVISNVSMDKIDSQQLIDEIQKRNPDVPIILMSGQRPDKNSIICAKEQGAVDYLHQPFSAEALTAKINSYINPISVEDDSLPVAKDPKSQALLSMALRVAQSDVGVMISGESGTGKEVLAHYIHDHSPRKSKPFIAINCAAIPDQMLEATLFGYEKGSFTGAYKATPGKFEQAEGGTLLLDEVSEMPLILQAKLLRVLQEREVERIGSNKLIHLNVRVLATSNRKLLDEVKAGRFREDLFYRLNVFPLHWLPLRERIHDIIPLANYLIRKHCQQTKMAHPSFTKAAEEALLKHNWPGNARELDNVVQRALVLRTDETIDVLHLQLPTIETVKAPSGIKNDNRSLQNHEYDFIEATLKEHQGNRQKVAAALGVSERTLRYKLAKMREEGYIV